MPIGTALTPRPTAGSLEELIAGATTRGPFVPGETRSDSPFERVEIDGVGYVLKHVHLDHDFTMRVSGDLGSRQLRAWQAGLMDAAPDLIDHAVIGMATGDGRNGWGVAILLRDVATELLPVGDGPIAEEQHLALLDACAGLSARLWGWEDDLGLLALDRRWSFFSSEAIEGERLLGFPEAVPRIAAEGWERFAERAPDDVRAVIDSLRVDPAPLVAAVRTTPLTFIHGDWKFSNLGMAADGRTLLIDWAYPGAGPVCHELGWYLALNRSRLPVGHTKESTIEDFRAALGRHGIETDTWWDRQLGLCLLGTLVHFGWEKALGDEDELGWWCSAAREGAAFL
jgi:hypothetical protein